MPITGHQREVVARFHFLSGSFLSKVRIICDLEGGGHRGPGNKSVGNAINLSDLCLPSLLMAGSPSFPVRSPVTDWPQPPPSPLAFLYRGGPKFFVSTFFFFFPPPFFVSLMRGKRYKEERRIWVVSRFTISFLSLEEIDFLSIVTGNNFTVVLESLHNN